MEELLNKLIKRGWKPFPNEWIDCYDFKFSNRWHDLMCCSSDDDDEYTHNYTYSWRDIASKDSWLWQFVCENGMIKSGRVFISWTKNASCDDYWNLFWDKACPKDFYEYRLIESAFRDESELENFLLQNIKVWNED